MKKSKTVFISTLFLGMALSGYSQYLATVGYTMSFATGETADFISKASFRGITLDGRGFLTDYVSLGGSVNWTTFYENPPEQTIRDGSLSITGTPYKYINACPILFNVHFYRGIPDEGLRIYGGVGIGTYYINQRTDMGLWTSTEDHWHFGFAPEIGLLLPVGVSSSVIVSVKWNYALKSGDSINYNWFGLNIGFSIGQ
jgi:hypothetical protein